MPDNDIDHADTDAVALARPMLEQIIKSDSGFLSSVDEFKADWSCGAIFELAKALSSLNRHISKMFSVWRPSGCSEQLEWPWEIHTTRRPPAVPLQRQGKNRSPARTESRNFKVARHTYAQQDVGVQSPCSQGRESLGGLATAGNLTKVCGPEEGLESSRLSGKGFETWRLEEMKL
ncbi:hypothetical protein B0H14DRAFT_3126332 [Mycena olivaceomarginata]|nr:hypothetical protein B0H14DRAFT_3126332 [Mycena olivaceomarginata]